MELIVLRVCKIGAGLFFLRKQLKPEIAFRKMTEQPLNQPGGQEIFCSF